jgi:hypothetical protein
VGAGQAVKVLLGSAAVIVSLSACGSTSAPGTANLVRPEAKAPAAGVCGGAVSGVGTVQILPSEALPIQPRCLTLRKNERLSIDNLSNEPMTVTLGHSYRATIGANSAYTFSVPVGKRLAPGVFHLNVTGIDFTWSSEIWVSPICNGPGPDSNCSTP